MTTPESGLPEPAADPGFLDPSMEIVLIEDDDGDALLVEELLADTAPAIKLRRAATVAEATRLLSDTTDCVLLDLALPDAVDLSGLDSVTEAAPGAAVIVLTGLADETRGLQAAARGAQDYLNKGQVDGHLLARAIRYALERKRADVTARRLAQSEMLAEENTRLERGLLPRPLVRDHDLTVTTRYRPGRRRTLLGGDFYDVVECPDGAVLAMIGDVSGHGPDEAALGVCLRIAWRTLVLGGTPVERIFPVMDGVLAHERSSEETFATAAMLRIHADRRGAEAYLAGHPAPVVVGDGSLTADGGVPLGIGTGEAWPATAVRLPAAWSILLFSDGLIEGHTGQGSERLGLTRLLELLDGIVAELPDVSRWPDELIDRVEVLNSGALADDLAMLVLSYDGAS